MFICQFLDIILYNPFKDFEFVVYLDSNENVFVNDGILNIKPTRLESIYGRELYEQDFNLGRE